MKLIKGFGLSGYRSFPSNRFQHLANLGDVNLVVGQNNAGKSNVLRLVQAADRRGSVYGALDRPSYDSPGDEAREAGFSIAFSAEDARAAIKLFYDIEDLASNHEAWVTALASTLKIDAYPELMWVRYRMGGKKVALQVDPDWALDLAESASHEENEVFRYASRDLTSTIGPRLGDDLLRVVSVIFSGRNLPRVETISAFRQIRPGVGEAEGSSNDGTGLIERLDGLRGPDAESYEDRLKFDSIEEFVRAVLDDPGLRIEIPSSRTTINVIRGGGGRPLPLENMGTGIHQVVILAAAATLLTETLVCMEEPEIHLHPILQRKLLKYLAERTTNQYLIATHSAHMLDSSLASIFHVSMTAAGSEIRPALLPQDRADICADLGYRASDLVQANAVVWVEGPSDRIYLQSWLANRAPDLIEGIDFSIMFYGGRLLNHLSARDPDVDDFISLKRLNRHVAILMDSDKGSSRAPMNSTKRRVRDEILADSGYVWVTFGYTIENYVPVQLFTEAVTSAHPSAVVANYGRFDNPLGRQVVARPATPDKVSIARRVGMLSNGSTTWQYDLEKKINELVDFIRKSNETVIEITRSGNSRASRYSG